MMVSLTARTTAKRCTSAKEKAKSQHYQEIPTDELKRLDQVDLMAFIRGDTRLPERYVFDPDLFPDYSRTTQRRLVTMIQDVCERQQSPVVVHQWANEEHDDRVVRRIRFRCAFFRKKKRSAAAGVPSCQFQFQVCYQAKYGWCLLNGKGQSHHVGHPLTNTSKQTVSNQKPSPKRTTIKPQAKHYTTVAKRPFSAAAAAAKPATESILSTEPCLASCVKCSPPASPLLYNDENINTVQAAWKDLKQTSTLDCKMAPAYTDFALDPDMEDIMDWGFLDEPGVALPTSVPTSAGGFLQKTVYLTETPFPEVNDVEDKCAGLMEALRAYAKLHDFVVTVEDYATVDRPGEKTLRVVLHCLGAGCCYQVALLWVVGLMRWQIYCQPDGIFVHGCGRLDGDHTTPCSAMAATHLNQALDHLVDFLNGEVVCPDGEAEKTMVGAWKSEEKPVSEDVRKETRKAVAEAAGRLDATASAA